MEKVADMPGHRKDAPIVRTGSGALCGVWQHGVAVFRGVPYAKPPVGEGRFAASAPHAGWSDVRDATHHGPIAPQSPSRLRVAMGDFTRPQDEDCLTHFDPELPYFA